MAFSCDLPNRPATLFVRVHWQCHSHSADECHVDLHRPARGQTCKGAIERRIALASVEETGLMSEFAQEWPPVWFHHISSALALSKQAESERRLQDFLATLSAETLRLAVFETTDSGGRGFGLYYGLHKRFVQR